MMGGKTDLEHPSPRAAASLPADWHCSIFVRVDESRFDVLRAALTGPPSSPYANGIFLFDIFLPREYNQQPPKVSIITTNGGQVRFGPNLYACGESRASVSQLVCVLKSHLL